MTDEMSAVLAGLTPTVVPVDGADPELIAISERYWAFAGFHPELGTPVWCEKTADIDTLGWGGPLYVVAAGGVRAVVDHTCPECRQQLSLTSRTALADLTKGETPVCVECTESLVTAVRKLNEPTRKAKRAAARARAAQQQAYDSALAAWRGAQRAPRVNMSTHAVNQFETHALRAVSDFSWPIKPFDEVADCGLSAMTRTLLHGVRSSAPADVPVGHRGGASSAGPRTARSDERDRAAAGSGGPGRRR